MERRSLACILKSGLKIRTPKRTKVIYFSFLSGHSGRLYQLYVGHFGRPSSEIYKQMS